MRKAAKVVIGIVIAIVGFFVFVAIVASTVPIGTTYEVSSADEVAGISGFVVLKDGSFYRARFSLMNNNSGIVTSDANATFTVTPTTYGTTNTATSGQSQTILYQRQFAIKAEDFQQYQLVLTGQPIIAYAWQFDNSEISNSTGTTTNSTDSNISSGSKTAVLKVALPNGKTYTADTTFF